MKINYLNIDEINFIHNIILENSWWLSWIKNIWQLESVLDHIKNDEYYGDFYEKASHLFFWIIKFRCFNDWNKRTAIISLNQFFKINWITIEDFWIKRKTLLFESLKMKFQKMI